MPYTLRGSLWTGIEPGWQQELAQAHREKARATCMCTAPGQEVYLALVAGHYTLRRMPGTGARHASSCSHFEPPLAISGEALLTGQAIVEDGTGQVTLKLDFPLAKFAGRTPPAPRDRSTETARSDGHRLTMRGLLHYLWKEADFHRWTPGMEGKRSYGTFFKYLQRAAAGKTVGGQDLGDLLVMPPPGAPDATGRPPQAAQMNLKLTRATAQAGGARRLGLVLGEVFAIEPHGLYPRIKLKCMLESPLTMPADLYDRMLRRFEAQLAMWQPGSDRLVMLGSFFCDAAGLPMLQEVALMNVTMEWIPFESLFEREVVSTLVARGRRFCKGLRFNLRSDVPMAAAILSDVGEPAMALFIEVPSADGEGLELHVRQAREAGLRIWTWRAGEELLEAAGLPAPGG